MTPVPGLVNMKAKTSQHRIIFAEEHILAVEAIKKLVPTPLHFLGIWSSPGRQLCQRSPLYVFCVACGYEYRPKCCLLLKQ